MFFRSKFNLLNLTENFLRQWKCNLSSVTTRFDSCTGCEIPCTKHVSYPMEILQKIDQSSMNNSVEKYRRHLCIAQSISPSQWPKDVKDLPGGYIKELDRILKAKQDTIGYSVKLTSVFIESKNSTEQTSDWYLFPDQLKLNNVNVTQMEQVIDKLFVKDRSIIQIKEKTKTIANHHTLPVFNEGIQCERLNGVWILVCCHSQRDQRCGK
ncbi:hypothetical protein I4U23_008194 [Adineta vaga]|nr:hypothetical protein I4U23_008194 [Adineta vaga]